jgi:hypothetical protein
MDHAPTSTRKRPRASFSPVPASYGGTLLEELFVGPSLGANTRAGGPTASLSTARKSPHSKPNDVARRNRDPNVKAATAQAERKRGGASLDSGRSSSSGGTERPSSNDSAESNDSDANSALPTSKKTDNRAGSRKGRLLLREEEDEEKRKPRSIVHPQPELSDDQSLPRQLQWEDDSNDSDYEDDCQDEESGGRGEGWDDDLDRKSGSTRRLTKPAGERKRIYRPVAASAPLPAAISVQKVAARRKKKRALFQEMVTLKRQSVRREGPIHRDGVVSQKRNPAERSRAAHANRLLNEHDEETSDQAYYSEESNVSDDESNLSFPKDDEDDNANSMGSTDNGVWTTLGGFIDDLSENRPVHRSTINFGMKVIEEEFSQSKDRVRRPHPSSSKNTSRTVSLARIKTQICKAVRAGLRSTSLPNLYVRIEDPCDRGLAKRTMERQSQTQHDADEAVILARRRDRFAKEAEKLQKQVDELNKELEREPTDVYAIHPHLRVDPPAANGVVSQPRAGPTLQFRQAPDGTSNAFLESMFPSRNS